YPRGLGHRFWHVRVLEQISSWSARHTRLRPRESFSSDSFGRRELHSWAIRFSPVTSRASQVSAGRSKPFPRRPSRHLILTLPISPQWSFGRRSVATLRQQSGSNNAPCGDQHHRPSTRSATPPHVIQIGRAHV